MDDHYTRSELGALGLVELEILVKCDIKRRHRLLDAG